MRLLCSIAIAALALGMSVPTASAKPPARSASAKKRPKKKRRKPKPRKPGSKPGKPDQAVRDMLTGQYPDHSTRAPHESKELKAMRALDRSLFPPRSGNQAAPWSTSIEVPAAGPKVSASGLPQAAASKSAEAPANKAPDLQWLAGLKMPDFPVRLDASVVRYLRYYKDTPRGQRLVKAWIKKSGRYRDNIVKVLRQYKLPEDLLWVALIESGFDAEIHSHAGAAGLWQFMPATGRIYGLTVNRRVDERLDPERATHAALKHLKDLYQRFGNWELAFSAYNMGYGGLLASVRKYNTNDFWKLRRHEAGIPYETALYAPKIMAMAIVANNKKLFGCHKVALDKPLAFGDSAVDAVSVAPGVTLDDVADAIKVPVKKVEKLNPHVIGSRLPPLQQSTLKRSSWTVYVPSGKGAKAKKEIPAKAAARRLGTHRVRHGETLATLAAAYGTSTGWIEALNDLHPKESPRPGTVVFVPFGRKIKSTKSVAKKRGVTVTVPKAKVTMKDRRRVFYEPVFGDTVETVARVTGVTATQVRRWNQLGPRASLQEGMHVSLWLPKKAHPKGVVLFEEHDVTVLEIGSKRFFEHHLKRRGHKRIVVVVKEGDTFKSIAKKYKVKVSLLERINQKSRHKRLSPGDKVIVYAK